MRDPAITSRMMARVRNRDSKAELSLRTALHRAGYRYRLHARDLPGQPDIVFRSERLVVFVDGDFWHGNAWRVRGLTALSELFPTRTDWWVAKIERNIARDREVEATLRKSGWAVVRVWESDVLVRCDELVECIVALLNARRREQHHDRSSARRSDGMPRPQAAE